jgi:hypothetical protein
MKLIYLVLDRELQRNVNAAILGLMACCVVISYEFSKASAVRVFSGSLNPRLHGFTYKVTEMLTWPFHGNYSVKLEISFKLVSVLSVYSTCL